MADYVEPRSPGCTERRAPPFSLFVAASGQHPAAPLCQNVILAAGAGNRVPLFGEIIRTSGLPASPQAERVDLADSGMVSVAKPA